MRYLKFFLPVLLLLFAGAEARWAEYEDASYEYKFYNENISINADGTYEIIQEIQAKVLKEHGREIFSRYRLNYNADAESLVILDAKTIYNGKEYVVDENMIEDKPLASCRAGFDQHNQIQIPFPKLEIGSEIYFKFKKVVKKVPIDNFFGTVLHFSMGGYLYSSNINIKSLIPLEVKINDPNNVLKVMHKVTNAAHNIIITLKKPIYESVINESYLDITGKRTTWVSLSSLSNWEDYAERFADKYYNIMNQELPELFIAIAKVADEKDDDEEKINVVTSMLAERVQYCGDWRTVEGGFFPRDLEKIAHSQAGDCKDFSIVTAAILQKLGYKVQPAFVMRGVESASNLKFLPTHNFNHAMLRVIGKNERVYWIDPTNLVSMAQGVFPDIANRNALVLDKKDGGFMQIPEVDPKNSKFIFNHELIIHNNVVDQQGTFTLQGEQASPVTGLGLRLSDKQIKDHAFSWISVVDLDAKGKKFLELPDLTSRIVKDLTFNYSFQQKNRIFKTSLGSMLKPRSAGYFNHLSRPMCDKVSDLFLNIPHTIEIRELIKNITIKDCERLNCTIDSPWIYVNRVCQHQNQDTELIDTIVIRKRFIPNGELQTSEFKNLQDELDNFNKSFIIIDD